MDKSSYKIVLLTILVLSVFTIAIIELTGISSKSLTAYLQQTKSRCEKMALMPKTNMQFYETKYNFGTVTTGRTLKHVFRYKNTGPNPLLICRADVSCGCTVPHFPDDPVAPGADGELVVEFNTSGKSGFQQKNIIVHSNAIPEAVSVGIQADLH